MKTPFAGRMFGAGLAVVGGLAIASGTAFAQETWTLKYAHVGPATEVSDDHIPGVFLKHFLESRSNGRIKVEIYPSSQLGDFRALIEQIQLGTLEMAHTSVGGIGQFFPEIQAVELPYLFPNDLVAEKVAEGPFFEEVRDVVLERTGNVRLGSVTNTGRYRSFFTAGTPVHVADDLSGVKMRTVDSPMAMEFVSFLGGSPTPIAWGELYTSLATGVVEGTKNSASDVPTNFYEVLKYLVLDEHSYLWGFNWISDSWLKSLPEDLQVLVADGLAQMADIQMHWNKQYEIRGFEEFKKAGGTLYVPSPEEKATFLEARDHMKEWFRNKYGPEWLDKLEQAIAAAEAEVEEERKKIVGG